MTNRNLLLILVFAMASTASAKEFHVFIGTYTGNESKGIYHAQFDSDTGKFTSARVVAETTNPSFVAIHPSRKFLYSVGETSEFEGPNSGSVNAFTLDDKTGDLKFLNSKRSNGAAPCHLVVDDSGKFVLTANYTGGSCNVLAIEADGSLGRETSFVQHKGASLTERQKSPHAHSINLDRADRFAFVADLGLDQILVYQFDSKNGTLKASDPPFTKIHGGAGPRHFSFHPTGKFAYVINELDSTITTLAYDSEHGTLLPAQSISTLPDDFDGRSSTAEVVVHPTGKFVYGSNRGHDSIAVFRVDSESGRLSRVEIEPTTGKTPRNFAVDPTGKFLLAENQSTDNIVVFSIDDSTGALNATGEVLKVPSPVCVKFLER